MAPFGKVAPIYQCPLRLPPGCTAGRMEQPPAISRVSCKVDRLRFLASAARLRRSRRSAPAMPQPQAPRLNDAASTRDGSSCLCREGGVRTVSAFRFSHSYSSRDMGTPGAGAGRGSPDRGSSGAGSSGLCIGSKASPGPWLPAWARSCDPPLRRPGRDLSGMAFRKLAFNPRGSEISISIRSVAIERAQRAAHYVQMGRRAARSCPGPLWLDEASRGQAWRP
jgi:hypothetical protein